MKNYWIYTYVFLIMSSSMLYSQNKKKKNKSYSEIITAEAKTDNGLFKVHKIEADYYYEIPISLLNTDMLLVSRISKITAGLGGGYLNAGSKTNQQLVQWVKKNNSIHLKTVSYENVAETNSPIYISVKDNNYQPIIAAFKIETYTPDSSAVVIKVNNLFTKDIPALSGLSTRTRKSHKIKSLDKERTFIDRISSYPKNIEVRHDMTFTASEPPSNSKVGAISIQMAQSMYLLPEEKMTPRLYDERVGWFTIKQIDYNSDELKSDKKSYIRRWKLIPKDKKAYAEGKLVEPVKQIVYYIDPATPKKWIPYFKQGIEDWQEAFEAAGFKNAIIAKDAPSQEEDPDWSPEDARYSTIRYIASETRNASGPSVSDPRSGEIIESDIMWYHNHLKSYRNRYLLETGAANATARTLDISTEEMGEMIRRVISHEVGHTLGLPHNMKASFAYPTDSLRSANFTQKWGLATTIMDYTRFNYVAQPGDTGVRWIRMLGPYDNYAINYGYRYIDNILKPEDEKQTLNSWINKHEGDPIYMFGARNSYDPSSQTECVGDNPILASTYGLSNLKIVAKNLNKWTTKNGENYDDLDELYGELIQVWSRYIGHVIQNVGGIYEVRKTSNQQGQVYTHATKSEQKEAINFLNKHVFTTPHWLLQKNIIQNIQPGGEVEKIRTLQNRQIKKLLNIKRLDRMIDNEANNHENAYHYTDMLIDLRKGIWAELKNSSSIDVYRRNVQRSHVARLLELLNTNDITLSDVSASVRTELLAIQKMCLKSSKKYPVGISKSHLLDIYYTIGSKLNNL